MAMILTEFRLNISTTQLSIEKTRLVLTQQSWKPEASDIEKVEKSKYDNCLISQFSKQQFRVKLENFDGIDTASCTHSFPEILYFECIALDKKKLPKLV